MKQRGTGSYARGVKGDAHLRPGCYVVEMPATTVGPKAQPPRCSQLPADLVAAIAEAGAAWRDDKYKVRRVRDVVRANQLPGVALFWNTHTPPLTVPPPLVFQFEPTTLDESEVALQALCDDVLTVAAAEEPDRRPSPSFGRRWLVRLLIPTITTVCLLSQFLDPCIVTLGGGSIVFVLLAVLFAAAGVYLSWWLSDQWLIVPGGVLVRRSLWGKVGESLKRCTPGDTLLLIRPGNPGWSAMLCGRGREQRRLTDFECAALLAAWQSPLPAPDRALLAELE